MREFWTSTLVLVVLFSMATVHADPLVNTGPCERAGDTCFLSIEDLVVDDALYDVTWIVGTLDDVLVSNPGVATFVNNRPIAQQAAEAVNEAFNSTGLWLPVFQFADFSGWPATAILIDFEFGPVRTYRAWGTQDLVSFSTAESFDEIPYAVFTRKTPVAVPEPGTLALLGAGLIGMGFAGRRRKAS